MYGQCESLGSRGGWGRREEDKLQKVEWDSRCTEWKSYDGRLALMDTHPGETIPYTKTDSITDFYSVTSLLFQLCFYVRSSFIRKCFIVDVVWGDHSAPSL